MRISDWSSDVCSSDLSQFSMRSLDSNTTGPSVPDRRADSSNVLGAQCNPHTALSLDTHPRGASRPIGRASCRERVWQYVKHSGVAGTLIKKKTRNKTIYRL